MSTTVVIPTGLPHILTRRGMNLTEAAQATGVPEEDLDKLYRGQAAGIRFTTLTAVCTGLGCTPAELLGPSPTPSAQPVRTTCRTPRWWVRAWAWPAPRLAPISALVSAVVATVFLLVVVAAVNPVDFLVYRYAAADAWAGENIYLLNAAGPQMPADGLPFTYTPFAALVLLVTTLSTPWGAFLGWSAATTVLSVAVFHRLVPPGWRDRPVPVGVLTVWGVCNIVTASHLIFGQINVFLMALVLFDLTRRAGTGPRWLPVGVLTGAAAAVKLTPALFIVHLWVSGQHRAARTSTLTAACATLVGFLIYPGLSWQFFTTTLWGLSDRVSLDGLFATSGNQSLHGALAALGPWTSPLAMGLSAVTVVAGLAAATTAHRVGRVWAAVLVIGLTACLVSPVSWMHHWVYLPPALVLLAQHHHSHIRYTAWIGVVVLLATGPTLGDLLLSWDQPALVPLGVVLRESLLLLALTCIGMLTIPTTQDKEAGATITAQKTPLPPKTLQ